MANEDVERFEVQGVWTGAESHPILFANAFAVQFDVDLGAHVLTIGQVMPPALLGTPDEVREQAEQIDFITIETLTRVAFTPQRMQELIAFLQANVDQRERAATLRPGDPDPR
jgi:hypothetical protein